MSKVTFFVEGTPRPQGSKRGFIRGGRVVLAETSKYHKEWRKAVSDAAKDAMKSTPRLEGHLLLELDFYFKRPKSHYRTGKYSCELRKDAPTHHIKTPDLDKLIRSVDDSLTGIVFEDDSQVVEVLARKHWAGGWEYTSEGVKVFVKEMV